MGATDFEVEYELVTADGVKIKRDWFTTSAGANRAEAMGSLVREEQRLQRLVDQGVDIW